jgi:alpha-tubulin suppressor-like RCC1 family protein/competence protein ComGC
MKKALKTSKAFTVVELVVVIVVIAVLAVVVTIGYNGVTSSARDKSLQSDVDSTESELARYAIKHNGIYGSALAWNSSQGANANIGFMPSGDNSVAVTSGQDGYCIQAYNPGSNYKTLATAFRKGQGCVDSWTQLSLGGTFTCGIGNDANAYCWGANGSGQLGGGTTGDSYSPVAIAKDDVLLGKTIKSLAVGGTNHVCAIASDNLAYCWGAGTNGRLGTGSSSSSATPASVSTTGVLSGKTMKALSSGNNSTCAIASDNLGYCWGLNTSGQLGNNSTTSSSSAVAVTMTGALAGKTLKNIATGGSSACAIASDNLVYCWGDNSYGQLGDGTTTPSSVPVAVNTAGVLSGKTIKNIAVAGNFACVIASDSKVYCWGDKSFGRLGDATSSGNSSVPVAVVWTGVLSGKTAKSIDTATSGGHTCIIASDNKAYCWGQGSAGQLGNSATTSTVSSPVAVVTNDALSGKTLSSIAVNGSHTCTIATTGLAYCWGSNTSGRLGDGTTTATSVPVQIARP